MPRIETPSEFSGWSYGVTSYSFTKQQLDYLAECIKSNNGSLGSSLVAFVDSIPNISMRELLNVWLPFAEKIKDDPEFPEKQFASHEAVVHSVKYEPTPESVASHIDGGLTYSPNPQTLE